MTYKMRFRDCKRRKIILPKIIDQAFLIKGKIVDYSSRITFLCQKNIDDIMVLEWKTNIPEIIASDETYRRRIAMEHNYFGFWISAVKDVKKAMLVCSFGWRPGYVNIKDPLSLPDDFDSYATPFEYPPVSFNALFLAGLNIAPWLREEGLGWQVFKKMYQTVREQAINLGCQYLVSDPRIHTYNGSNCPGIEFFRQDPKMKEIVDLAVAGKREFTREDAMRDPELRLYDRLIRPDRIEFLRLLPSTWFPQDVPSGGHGMYVFVDLCPYSSKGFFISSFR